MKEPDGARGTKGRGAAGGVESRGSGWSMPDQGGAGGTREPDKVKQGIRLENILFLKGFNHKQSECFMPKWNQIFGKIILL